MRKPNRTRLAALAAVAATTGVVAFTMLPAAAAAQTQTVHQREDATGAVVMCGATPLTVTGYFETVTSMTLDASGVFHITSTGVPRGVTLDDGTGHTYFLRGATHFSGKFGDAGPIVLTSTDKFSIVSAGGGLLGSVNGVEHSSPNGNVFAFDLGSCEAPS